MTTKLGSRLRQVREGLHLTQDELAREVGLSSEFISLVEIGKRAPSLNSLKKISDYVRKDMSFFLEDEIDPFQKLLSGKNLTRSARVLIKDLRDYCQDYLKLEDMTGRRLPPAPYYSDFSPGRLAQNERGRMGIGDDAVRDVFGLFEIHGLRLVRKPFPDKSRLAGIFVYFKTEQAAFGMIDSTMARESQALMAAHLYGHYLRDRHDGPIADNPDVLIREYLPLYHPRERRAQEFAESFLLPIEKLNALVRVECEGDRIRYVDVIRFKRYFGVPAETVLHVLVDSGLLSPQQADEFAAVDHAEFEKSLYGAASAHSPAAPSKGALTSSRYKSLAVIALGTHEPEKT